MSVVAIIQGRMGSARFPGKTMFSLAGKPSIEHLSDAVLRVFSREQVVIATSDMPIDNAIAEFCDAQGIECFRGDEENVASRFLAVAESKNADYFVRLNADSPLLDFRVIETVLQKSAEFPSADVISTSVHRTFPSGTNVELVKTETFSRFYPNFFQPEHFEHVTKFFYENAEKFSIISVESGIEKPERYKFSFDTQADGKKIAEIFDILRKPHSDFTLAEKCAFYDELFGEESC